MSAMRRVYARRKGRVKRKCVISMSCATYPAMAVLPPRAEAQPLSVNSFIFNDMQGGVEYILFGISSGRDAFDAHIWPQNLWNEDGTVGLLVVFHHRDPCAADRQAAAVEGVDEVRLAAGLGFVADASAARLEGLAVGAAGNFAKFLGAGQPDFDVVGFCGGETHVAGRKQRGAIVESEFLQNGFGVGDQLFVFLVTFFRARKFK